MKPTSEIRDNLMHVIKWNLNVKPESANLDFSKPCIISRRKAFSRKKIFSKKIKESNSKKMKQEKWGEVKG